MKASRPGSKHGMSAHMTRAVRHQLAMDGLAEIVTAHEAEHGALTAREIDSAHSELFGEQHEQDTSGCPS